MYIKKIVLSLLGSDTLTRLKCECGSDEFISEPNSYDIVIVEEEIIIDHSEIIETSKYYCRECGKEYEEINGILIELRE